MIFKKNLFEIYTPYIKHIQPLGQVQNRYYKFVLQMSPRNEELNISRQNWHSDEPGVKLFTARAGIASWTNNASNLLISDKSIQNQTFIWKFVLEILEAYTPIIHFLTNSELLMYNF